VKRGSWCPKCAGIRRKSKWTVPKAIEQFEVFKVGVPGKSLPRQPIVDASTDKALKLMKESSLKSLRFVTRMPRKSESAHKSH
jgi:hypothetical protein